MNSPPKRDNASWRLALAQSIVQGQAENTAKPRADQAHQVSVVVDKRAGVGIVFATRLDQAAAELIVVRLAAVGCLARVVPMLAIDAPGLQRRPR